MIIEYDSRYNQDIEELLYELQEYLMSIDKEQYYTISKEYKRENFKRIMAEIKRIHGKILLYEESNKIVGIIVGCINNEEKNMFDIKTPKIGRILYFIVSEKYRRQKVGEKLFKQMEKKLKEIGCKSILINVFDYNELAKSFYEKMGYHPRTTEMIKTDF